jgi:hypothetical protein
MSDKFYFSSPIKNLKVGDFQFDNRGLLTLDTAEESEAFAGLVAAFGRGVVGEITNLGNYNPYAPILESTNSQGPAQTGSKIIDTNVNTPSVASVDTGDSKPVTVSEVKPGTAPVVSAAVIKPAVPVPGIPPVAAGKDDNLNV